MLCQISALLVVELLEADDAHALLGQRGAQVAFETVAQAPPELEHALADPGDRLRGRESVLAGVLHTRIDLVVQPRHAHHVVLVEVGRVDRAELDALQQRSRLVLAELQHTLVEVQPRELAVDVQRGVLQPVVACGVSRLCAARVIVAQPRAAGVGGLLLRFLPPCLCSAISAQLFYARRTSWLWPASSGCSVTPTQSPTVRVPTQSAS